MYQQFDPAIVPMTPAHDCCVLTAGCTCDEGADPDSRIKLPFERTEQCFRISSTSVLTRAVSSFDKEVLKAALTDFPMEVLIMLLVEYWNIAFPLNWLMILLQLSLPV